MMIPSRLRNTGIFLAIAATILSAVAVVQESARDASLTDSDYRIIKKRKKVSFDPTLGRTLNDDRPQPDRIFKNRVVPFLENHCLDCHSGEDAEGDIDLEQFTDIGAVQNNLETWAHVLKQLENKDMPPKDCEPPNPEDQKRVENWILSQFAAMDRKGLELGKVRRLNRIEYENTVRELFRLSRDCFNNSARITRSDDYFQPSSGKMPRYVLAVSHFFNGHRRHSDLPGVSSLPVDPPVEHGFSNDHEALSLSPILMEAYFNVSTGMLNSPEFPLICGIWEAMFVATEPGDEPQRRQARRQIELFLPRAFRRPVDDVELGRYFALFDREWVESKSYTEAMKTTVAAILVSPSFLYRHDLLTTEDPEAAGGRMDEHYALASRLSYFLWGSMPDDVLYQAAEEKRLVDKTRLGEQVDRMLNDRRAKSLSTDFGMQWLKVQKAASALPDESVFPIYYQAKVPPPAVSMMIEQMLFFETIMVENRSILDFISADFAYLNRQLMDIYQFDGKAALGFKPRLFDYEDFYRVKWPNTHRGGVITAGATLVSTSTTTRTSPVFRGAWILDVIFNSPPPAPPADVPPLEPEEEDASVKLNVRKKLEQHRLNPACASCHDRMDPLGFALERFDPIGRWRNEYETGDSIDTTGDVDGERFNGAARFKAVLMRKKSKFVKAFVEHTMKYALGRQLHYSDQPEIRKVVQLVGDQEYRFRSVMKQVVLSEPFRRYDRTDRKQN